MNNLVDIGKIKVMMTLGQAGTSIASIEKTSTSTSTDYYTITLTDGSTTQLSIEKGVGIVSIEKTSTVGLVDTYTITLTNGDTTTFEVINGQSYTVPTDGVLYYEGNTVPEGFEQTTPPAGQAVEIDDSAPSAYKVYSSEKTEEIYSQVPILLASQLIYAGTISTSSNGRQYFYFYPVSKAKFFGITVPSGYEIKYRISAIMNSSDSNNSQIYVNATKVIDGGNTWIGSNASYYDHSGDMYYSDYFKFTDIATETRYVESSSPYAPQAWNIGVASSESGKTAYARNVTLHAYMVRTSS